jgi:hypothetical protein
MRILSSLGAIAGPGIHSVFVFQGIPYATSAPQHQGSCLRWPRHGQTFGSCNYKASFSTTLMIIRLRTFSLNISCNFKFLSKVTRNRGRDVTWVCLLGGLGGRHSPHSNDVEALVLKAVGNVFQQCVWGKMMDSTYIGFLEFGKKVKQWWLLSSKYDFMAE